MIATTQQAMKSMTMAMGEFAIEEIDAIVMHAPGTIKGDLTEYKAIEKVFGEEYTTWTEVQNPPILLKKFLEETMKNLYTIYPFQLAMIDYEISGQYYLNDLKSEFENFTYSKFYIGKEFECKIAENNKPNIIVIN